MDNDPSARGAGRRTLEKGALELLGSANLDDLLRFITARKLIETTGISNGAIYKVSRGPAALARRAVLAEATALGEPTIVLIERLAELEVEIREGYDEARLAISAASAENVMGWATGSGQIEFTGALLAAAVALNDADAAATLHDYYESSVELYAAVLSGMMRSWHREPLDEFDAEFMAVLSVSMGDGLAMRARFDPRITPQLIASALQVIWAGTTRRIGSLDDDLEFRLGVDHVRRNGSERAGGRREALETAVQALYRSEGWPAVTLAAVAEHTKVSRATIRTEFGDRDGLSVAIWSRFVPGLRRAAASDSRLAVTAIVERFLLELVSRAQDHPEVTESLRRCFRSRDLRVALRDPSARDASADSPAGAPTGGGQREADPRMAVPLAETLFEVLAAQSKQFRPIGVGQREQLFQLANVLCDISISRAVLEPAADPLEVVSFAMATCLDGSLKKRRSSSSRPTS